MKAMIFAAGLGTRLRPLTDNCPKALVEVGGVPMLQRVITHLSDCGFDQIVVNVHHFGEMIMEFLRANNNFGLDMAVSDERGELLDTGGALVKARQLLDGSEPFLVHNADILTDINLGTMMAAHKGSGRGATLLVSRRDTSRYLLFDKAGRLHGWTNVKSGEKIPTSINPADYERGAFGGIHVVEPRLLAMMCRYCPEGPFPIVPFYVQACSDELIGAYTPEEDYQWFDIGKPATLAEAEKYFAR